MMMTVVALAGRDLIIIITVITHYNKERWISEL
jgi:hypothetical protein